MIGRIERVPLRKVWRHEAHDFTTWLQDNIDVLGDVINVNLSNAEREQSAGSFNVDIVAEDDAGNPVVIENQLEKSDHDHLGKLITYLVARGAQTAIWIVSSPRPEHINAVTWLNEGQSADFYLLKIEAIQIGESEPAPLLTLIVGPTEEAREVGEQKREFKERHHLRHEFWTSLLASAKGMTTLHSNISPSKDYWISTGAGISGVNFNYVLLQDEARVEAYIDRGKNSANENVYIFNALNQHKRGIEEAFQGQLDWQRLEDRRACRIAKTIALGGLHDKDKWPEIQTAMIENMIRLSDALQPHLTKMRKSTGFARLVSAKRE